MPKLRVVSVAHDIGDRRLHRLVAAATDAGFDVEVVAVGASENAPPTAARVVVMARPSKLRRLVRAVTVVFASRCDVLVVIDPDLIPGALAARFVRRAGQVVVDVHEDFAAVAADRRWIRPGVRRAIAFAARILSRMAARADITIVADDHLPPHRARRRIVVDNRPALGDPPLPERRARSCVYVGDVRASRGAHVMVEAIAALPTWHLDLVGPINDPDDRDAIDRVVSTHHNITVHGRLGPDASTALMRSAEVGLVILDDTPAFRDALPSKMYEYLDVGLAIVASPLPRMTAMLAASSAGHTAATAAELSAVLTRWAADPDELRAHQDNARRHAQYVLAPHDGFQAVWDSAGDESDR